MKCECSDWLRHHYIIGGSNDDIYLRSEKFDIDINYCPICGKRLSDTIKPFPYKRKG